MAHSVTLVPGQPLEGSVVSVSDDGEVELELFGRRRIWVRVPLEQVPRLRQAALGHELEVSRREREGRRA